MGFKNVSGFVLEISDSKLIEEVLELDEDVLSEPSDAGLVEAVSR